MESVVESADVATPVLPLVYTGRSDASRANWATRFIAFGLAFGCLGVLMVAARLRPSPEGHGSHTGLGLQKCQFIEQTGLPCPSCGMTTSFAWFAHGNLLASAYVQPMGFVLALLAAATVWVGFYVAITGRPAHRLMRLVPGRYYYLPLLALALAAWGWKILIHLNRWDGWH